MKRILLALAVIFGLSSAALAQEVTLSYGAYTQMDALNNHKGFKKTETAWGSVNVGLYLPLFSNVKVGPSYSYSSQYTPEATYNTPYGPLDLKSKVGYHTLMLNAKSAYYANSIVTLYGHVGAGIVIANMMPRGGDTYNKGYFAAQISPLCAEVEFYPGVSMFGELGFGAQGLMQAGFKYAF